MEKLIALFSLFISFSAMGATYYMAPDGSDYNNGSISQPFATLNKVWTVIGEGDLVYLRGGTYYFSSQQDLSGKNGTAGNLIQVWAYPDEQPVLTKSQTLGLGYPAVLIQFNGNYFHWKGIEIMGHYQENSEGHNGMWANNSSHNIFEELNVHHNGSGFYIRGNSDDNLFLNCDFHHNEDPYSGDAYGNADGMGMAFIPAGNTNTVRGCRFWLNSDDGLDLWLNEGFVRIENCWSWSNGYIPGSDTPAGDGNGFKLGIQDIDHNGSVLRSISNCVAYNNRQRGFDQNSAQCSVELYNNTSYNNGRNGFLFNYFDGIDFVAKNNIAYADDSKSGFTYSSTLENNTFLYDGNNNSNYSVSDDDFISLDATQLSQPRNSDGSLPDIEFLHLVENSDLVDAGVYVDLPYNGSGPDLGAFEYGTSVTPPPRIPVNTGIDFDEANPTIIDLHFNYAINYQIIPPVSNFTVVLNGNTNFDVASVSIADFTVTLTLENPVNSSGILSVRYTKTGVDVLQTWIGEEVESFTAQTSVTIDTPPEEELTVRIFTSPLGEYIAIHILGAPITTPHFIRFYDTAGELIYEDTLKTNASNIPVNFPSGVYLVDIGLGNKVLYSQRIVLN